MEATLLYSGECPYCNAIGNAVDKLDRSGDIECLPIESEKGQDMVIEHHGEYVHAPHFFTDERVYFGVGPVAKQTIKTLLT